MTTTGLAQTWTPALDTERRGGVCLDLDDVNAALEGRSPQVVLHWAAATFGDGLVLQSSMQRRSSVLMHMLWAERLNNVPALFVDTGFHFPETLEARDELSARYGVRVLTVHPELSPDAQRDKYQRDLWRRPETYKHCCYLRKERPFVAAASRYDAIVSGLQRAEGGARSDVKVVGWDPRIEAYTVHPLAAWSSEQLQDYIDEHDVYLHPLHALGFPSIGCAPCTTPVESDEHIRAGRWRHIREALEAEQSDDGEYCDINWIDQAR